ncbi:MAG: zinc ribbon domain-containing protein [Acidobacteriota bacterium]|nr:zinc ribbon domain-containing protein [Acidobacteriota bacterium]
MPLYEYACESCGEHFDVIEKFSAEPLTIHEKCGGKVYRVITAPALKFKGSGFYVNDYAKSGGGEKKTESNGSTKAEAGKSDATKTDSVKSESAKTESKSESTPASTKSD